MQGGRRAAPPDDCGGAMNYLERLDSHRRGVPIEDFVLMTDAMQRLLDSGGDRKAMGNLEELREAMERLLYAGRTAIPRTAGKSQGNTTQDSKTA